MGAIVELPTRAAAPQTELALERPEDLEARYRIYADRFAAIWRRRDMPADVRDQIRATVNGLRTGAVADEAVAVLEHLNRKRAEVLPGRRAFRATAANLRPIQARLAAGYSADDLRAVVAVKCRQVVAGEWGAQYLTPETLFRPSKFDKYVAELPASPETD